jgi:hypothetical protein
MFDGREKGGAVFFHVVRDDEGGGLNKCEFTRDMPAPQCTSTEPRLRSVCDKIYFIRWCGKKVRSMIVCFSF